MSGKSDRVREPIQVYLDQPDRALLDALAAHAALPRAEILRLGLRRLSADLPGATRPGSSLASLVGALDTAPAVPGDLAARHDEYLYSAPREKRAPARKRSSTRKRASTR